MTRDDASVTCPLCLAIEAASNVASEGDGTLALDHVTCEGFLLGVAIERAAKELHCQVANLLCGEHLNTLRAIARAVPENVCPPNARHLIDLSLGLSLVKSE